MKNSANLLAKFGIIALLFIGFVYRADVWAWVSGKSVSELSEMTAGFLIKWAVLGFLFFGAATLPHYVKPYLELFRMKGIAKVRKYRKGGGNLPAPRPRANPRENYAQQLIRQLLFKNTNMSQPARPTQNDPRNDIHLRF